MGSIMYSSYMGYLSTDASPVHSVYGTKGVGGVDGLSGGAYSDAFTHSNSKLHLANCHNKLFFFNLCSRGRAWVDHRD